MGLDGIVFNIPKSFSEMFHVADVAVEILDLPEAATSAKQAIDLQRREGLPGMEQSRKRNLVHLD